MAQREHWCDRCCSHILPGEMYEADVQLYDNKEKHRLCVMKRHVHPSCDFPPDPDEDKELAVRRRSKIEKFLKAA